MTEVAVVLVLIFFVLLLCNVPVAVAIGTASLAAVYANGGMGAPERIGADRMVSGVSSFSLLAIPFFVLSGFPLNINRLSSLSKASSLTLLSARPRLPFRSSLPSFPLPATLYSVVGRPIGPV